MTPSPSNEAVERAAAEFSAYLLRWIVYQTDQGWPVTSEQIAAKAGFMAETLVDRIDSEARRQEREKTLKEACAAVCRGCAAGSPVSPPDEGDSHWWHTDDYEDCEAEHIRALMSPPQSPSCT